MSQCAPGTSPLLVGGLQVSSQSPDWCRVYCEYLGGSVCVLTQHFTLNHTEATNLIFPADDSLRQCTDSGRSEQYVLSLGQFEKMILTKKCKNYSKLSIHIVSPKAQRCQLTHLSQWNTRVITCHRRTERWTARWTDATDDDTPTTMGLGHKNLVHALLDEIFPCFLYFFSEMGTGWT